ncbi:MAG: cohesin domain-containing protein [Lachnospiraceae bacterium]
MQKRKIKWVFGSILLSLFLLVGKQDAYAAEVAVTFGSMSYEENLHETFPIGVYINSDAVLGNYQVEVSYDATRLRYVDGGTSAQDGVVVLAGSGTEPTAKHMLHFEALVEGDTSISVKSATVKVSEEAEAEAYEVKAMGQAPIAIKVAEPEETEPEEVEEETKADTEQEEISNEVVPDGEAEVTAISTESGSASENAEAGDDIPVMDEIITTDGERLFIVDHSVFIPEEADWQYNLLEETWKGKPITFLCDTDSIVRILYLMDESGQFAPYAFSENGEDICPCLQVVNAGIEYLQIAAEICVLPEGLTPEKIQKDAIACYLNKSGNCYFYKQDTDGLLLPWNYESEAELTDRITLPFYILVGAVLAVFLLTIIVTCVVKRKRKNDVELLISEAELSPFEYDDL